MKKWIIMIGVLTTFMCQTQYNTSVTSSSINKDCYYRDFELKDARLLKKLRTYLGRSKRDELPLISIVHNKDSLFVYLSGVVATNAIKNCSPSYLTIIDGKEVAVYNSQETIQDGCLDLLVQRYRTILRIDKSIARKGLQPGDVFYYSYESDWVKITLVNNKIVDVDEVGKPPREIPFFKFSF